MTDSNADRPTNPEADANREANPPPIIDRHEPPAVPRRAGPMGSIEGADRAALGLSAEPESSGPGAQVDPSETQVPGPHFGDVPADAEKPWDTSLATKSDDAGIGAEPDPEGEI